MVVLLSTALVCARASNSLDDDERDAILSAHNYYRSIVDPLATNMEKMVSQF